MASQLLEFGFMAVGEVLSHVLEGSLSGTILVQYVWLLSDIACELVLQLFQNRATLVHGILNHSSLLLDQRHVVVQCVAVFVHRAPIVPEAGAALRNSVLLTEPLVGHLPTFHSRVQQG